MRPLLPSPCRAGKTLANFWRRGGPYFRPPRFPPGLRDRRIHFAVFQATGVAVFQALRLSRDPGRGSGDTLADLASSSDRIPGPRTSRPGGSAAIGIVYARGCRIPGPHPLRRSTSGRGNAGQFSDFRDRISGPAWPPCPHGPGVLARRVRVAVFQAPTLGPGHWPRGHFAGVGVGRPSSRPPIAHPPRLPGPGCASLLVERPYLRPRRFGRPAALSPLATAGARGPSLRPRRRPGWSCVLST